MRGACGEEWGTGHEERYQESCASLARSQG